MKDGNTLPDKLVAKVAEVFAQRVMANTLHEGPLVALGPKDHTTFGPLPHHLTKLGDLCREVSRRVVHT
eukprot:9336455-Alexandrium_andersonii.AAC.1